jgi:hypothetical protein
MIDPEDYILGNIDVSNIDPDFFHEGPKRTQLDIVIKTAFEPSCGNTLRIYQQIPKQKRTPETRIIPIGWAKVSSPPPRFAHDKNTDTY